MPGRIVPGLRREDRGHPGQGPDTAPARAGLPDGGRDHADFLVAEQALFAGVGFSPANAAGPAQQQEHSHG